MKAKVILLGLSLITAAAANANNSSVIESRSSTQNNLELQVDQALIEHLSDLKDIGKNVQSHILTSDRHAAVAVVKSSSGTCMTMSAIFVEDGRIALRDLDTDADCNLLNSKASNSTTICSAQAKSALISSIGVDEDAVKFDSGAVFGDGAESIEVDVFKVLKSDHSSLYKVELDPETCEIEESPKAL